MPHRFFFPACEVMLAALSTLFVAVSNVLDGGFGDATTIWDKNQLRMYCLIGAIGGAFLAILIFPPKADETQGSPARRMAGKFISSGISGMVFTPILIRWLGWPVNVDVVLAASAGVALCGVGLLHQVVPLVTRKVIVRIFGDSSSSSDNQPPSAK